MSTQEVRDALIESVKLDVRNSMRNDPHVWHQALESALDMVLPTFWDAARATVLAEQFEGQDLTERRITLERVSLEDLMASNPSRSQLQAWLDAHDRDVEAAGLYRARQALQDDQIERYGVILPDVVDVVNWLDDRAQRIQETRAWPT